MPLDAAINVIDPQLGPGLFRRSQSAGTPDFALTGNALGFGGGLFPNSGLLENRTDFEWEMGCISWDRGVGAGFAKRNPSALARLGESRFHTKAPTSKTIKFRCNPAEVTWSLPQRSVEQKTKAGTVLHVWNDRDRKSYYDEPTLTFKLQTGNIIPSRDINNPRGVITDGLNNFYEFMALVDEVKVLDDGRANLCWIDYNSLIFPRMRLWGFWQPNGISFSDSAESHAQVNNWTASFTVYRSFPELGRNVETKKQSVIDGSLAGNSLRSMFNQRSGFTFSNRRNETFGLIQDASTSVQAISEGQIAPRDIITAAKASINTASQRILQKAATVVLGTGAIFISDLARGSPRGAGFF